MISFETTRFGRLEVAKEKIIYFPNGLIGFPHVKRYILMDYKDTLLKWLQAIDDPHIAFIVLQPFEFFPEYSIKIDDAVKNILAIEKEEDITILVILRVDGDKVTANLQGPMVLNSINKKGIQIINEDPQFSSRTPMTSPSTVGQK